MASNKSGGGSLVLKLLILVLIVVLGYSVHFPKQQWARQADDLALARDRMENLYNAANIYRHFNKTFPGSIGELVTALDTTVIPDAEPFSFSFDQKQDMDLLAEKQDLLAMELRTPEEDARLKTLLATARDSLLITLDDTMRIDQFIVQDLGQRAYFFVDSLALAEQQAAEEEAAKKRKRRDPVPEPLPVPTYEKSYYTTLVFAGIKDLYHGMGTDTLYLLSENPITVVKRYETSISRDLWASTTGDFQPLPDGSRFARGAAVAQPVRNFSFTLPLDELSTCPATGNEFLMKHVAKYVYKGAYLFTLDGEEGEPLRTLARKQAFLNEVKGLASGEIGDIFKAIADSATAAGFTAFRVPPARQQAIIVEKTLERAATLKAGQELLADADNSIVAGVDSMAYYTDPELRENTLFAEYQDQTAKHFEAMLAVPAIDSLVSRVRLVAEFEDVRVDTVGVTIYSPITGDEVYTAGWQRIFEVAPPANHGFIYNGTRSWE